MKAICLSQSTSGALSTLAFLRPPELEAFVVLEPRVSNCIRVQPNTDPD